MNTQTAIDERFESLNVTIKMLTHRQSELQKEQERDSSFDGGDVNLITAALGELKKAREELHYYRTTYYDEYLYVKENK